VSRSIASRVDIECHNLFADRGPLGPFHVIVCRNLFIYLDWYQQHALAQQFSRHLVHKGYLVLGDLEDIDGLSAPFRSIGQRVYQHDAHSVVKSMEHSRAPVGPPEKGARILLIDGDVQLLELTASFLTGLGYVVDTSSRMSESYRLIRQRDFDLLALDLSFAGTHSTTLMSAFNARPRSPPVILLTRQGYDEPLLNTLLSEGATRALSKTLPIGQFAQSINCCLRDHFNRRVIP
jgi:CheY-like chemotaxis protein